MSFRRQYPAAVHADPPGSLTITRFTEIFIRPDHCPPANPSRTGSYRRATPVKGNAGSHPNRVLVESAFP